MWCIYAHIFAILSYMKSLQLAKPHLLVMVGIPGSGKSCFAEKFAETFGAPYVTYDKIRPFTESDEAAQLIANLQTQELIKTHQTVIVDSGAETRTERAELARIARTKGYETLFIWVQTDPATAKMRALKSKGTSDHSLSSDEYDRLFRRFTAPNASEKTVVISGKHTYATQAKVVLKKLSESRAEISRSAPSPRPSDPTRRNITIH